MPHLSITLWNEPFESIRQKLMAGASALVAKTLVKSESSVCVTVPHAAMLFGGEPGPAAFLELRSLGGLDANVNAVLSRKLCKLLESEIDIPPERVFLNFVNVERGDWGWNGKTFL